MTSLLHESGPWGSIVGLGVSSSAPVIRKQAVRIVEPIE